MHHICYIQLNMDLTNTTLTNDSVVVSASNAPAQNTADVIQPVSSDLVTASASNAQVQANADEIRFVSSETVTVDLHNIENPAQTGRDPEGADIDKLAFDLSNLSIQSQETQMEDLEDQLQTDPKKLISKVKRMIAMNTSKVKSLKSRVKLMSTDKERSVLMQLVVRAMGKMSMYSEFLELSLDKDLPDTELDEIQLFVIQLDPLITEYQEIVSIIRSLESTGEQKVEDPETNRSFQQDVLRDQPDDQSAFSAMNDEFVTTRRPTRQKPDRSSGNIPMGNQTIQAEATLLEDQNRMGSAPRSQNETSWKNRRSSVRFSSIPTYGEMSTPRSQTRQESRFTIDDEDNAWREFEVDTMDLRVLTILDILKSMHKITSIELSEELGDVEVAAIDKRERPAVQALKASLKKDATNLPPESQVLGKHAASAFKAGSKWLAKLDLLVKKKNRRICT